MSEESFSYFCYYLLLQLDMDPDFEAEYADELEALQDIDDGRHDLAVHMILTLPSLAGVAALKSLITLYINICKITFFPSTQFAYIYVSIFICMLCYKDQLGDFTYIYV